MKNTLLRLLTTILSVSLLMGFQSCSKNVDVIEQNPEVEVDYGNINDLMHLSEGSTLSTKTPMGIYFENLKVTTTDDINWLNTASNEPSLPSGNSQDLQLKAFNVELFPFGNPSPADCNQQVLGDCSAISIFAEMAYINPAFIKSIITDNKDNTFTVKMFDPQGKSILVSVTNKFMSFKSDGKLAGVNGKSNQATWATVLEKVLMKYIDKYKLVSSIEGIGSEFASPPFTGDGNSFAFYPNKLNTEQIKRAVEVSLAQGKLVIGGFNKADVQVGQSKTITAHAWSFSYAPKNETNNYQSIFVMRNPWGHDNGTDFDGQMFIPSEKSVITLIDLRIINSGKAKPEKTPIPYTPPNY